MMIVALVLAAVNCQGCSKFISLPGLEGFTCVEEKAIASGFEGNLYKVKKEAQTQILKAVPVDPNKADQFKEIKSKLDIQRSINSEYVVKTYVAPRQTSTPIDGTNYIYFTNEAVDGQNIQKIMNTEGETFRHNLLRKMEIFKEIGLGLKAIHDAGIIHGDVKDLNVMVTSAGHVKLKEFVESRRADQHYPIDANSNKLDVRLALELLDPNHTPGKTVQFDTYIDICFAGILFYKMHTGNEQMFNGVGAELAEHLRQGDYHVSNISPLFALFLHQLTHSTTTKRTNAGEMIEWAEYIIQAIKEKRPAAIDATKSYTLNLHQDFPTQGYQDLGIADPSAVPKDDVLTVAEFQQALKGGRLAQSRRVLSGDFLGEIHLGKVSAETKRVI